MVTSDLDVSVKDKENAKIYANTYRNLRPIKGSPIPSLIILSLIIVYREKSLSWGAYSRSQHSQHNKQVWSFLKGDPGMFTVLNRTFCRCLTSTATAKFFGWIK